MKAFKALAVSALAMLFTGQVWAADKTGWPDGLRFLAGPPGGNWFALGGALSEMWSHEVMPVTSGTGGGVSNIINIDRSKGDMGFSVASLQSAADAGIPPFKQKTTNVAVLANAYPQVTYFIAREDFLTKHGIKDLGDLVEKKIPVRFATLKPGTSSEFIIAHLFDTGYGVDYRDAIKSWGGSVQYASYSDGADLISDNHIDVFAFSVGEVAAIVMNIESQTKVKLLAVDKKALAAMENKFKTYTYTIKPGGAYKCVTAPVEAVGDYTSIVIRKDLPDSLAYELAKAMLKNQKGLSEAVKDFGSMTAKSNSESKLPIHPGARKFWSEAAKAGK